MQDGTGGSDIAGVRKVLLEMYDITHAQWHGGVTEGTDRCWHGWTDRPRAWVLGCAQIGGHLCRLQPCWPVHGSLPCSSLASADPELQRSPLGS